MATYVCSDIHGMFNEFLGLLKYIDFSKDDKLYILGDVIDRGLNSVKTLEYIMKADNIIMILGNHELAMLDYYRGGWECDSWMNHEWFLFGGKTTRKELSMIGEERKNKILEYVESLPHYLIVDNFVLVHGGFDIYGKEMVDLKEVSLEQVLEMNNRDSVVWNRDFLTGHKKIKGYTTIMGHTPTITFGSEEIMLGTGKILIDCGCAFGGRLACLRLDDMKEFYI